MTNCLLINPQMPFDAPKEDSWIRLGLAHLSSCLKKEGHEVSLLDYRMLYGWMDVESHLAKIHPDVVFITAFTTERDSAIRTAKLLKDIDPSIVTCVGGIHASIAPEDYENARCFDFIVRGEGEVTVPKIAAGYRELPLQIADNKGSTTMWGETPDLNAIPFPDRELWDDYATRINYPPPWLNESPWVDVLMMRGCNSKCKFCVGPGESNHFTREVNGKRQPYIRGRSVENVIAELLELDSKYHYRSIHFDDDQFIMNTNWMWSFLKALKENGLDDKRWWVGSRADVILRNKELVLEMQRCGLDIMSVGFESFNDHMLQFWNKGTTVQQNIEAAAFLKDNGIRIFSNVIFGAPREDGKYYPEDDRVNIDALKKIKPEFNSWSIFTATPGCDLYEWAKEKNLIVANDNGWRGCNEQKIRGVSPRRIRLIADELLEGQVNSRPWYHTWHDKFRLLIEGD